MRILNFENHMRVALKQAHAALMLGEMPVGAVVVRDNQVIALAHNLVETNGSRAAHAEMLAMERALMRMPDEKRLVGCTLFSTLEPCAMCAGAAINYGLERIVFGAFDKQFGCVGSLVDIPYMLTKGRIMTLGGVLAAECEEILRACFESARKS